MYKISDKIIKFITENMKNWKVELTAEWKTLVEVKFLEDALPRRRTFSITIRNSNDATQLHTKEMHWRQ